MSVTRIVPNLPVTDVTRANALYAQLFGLDVGMDLGWIGNLSPTEAPHRAAPGDDQGRVGTVQPDHQRVGVAAPAEVDAIHERVVAAGLEVVHPFTDEDWGVHRFFFRDHDDNVVNVVAHV